MKIKYIQGIRGFSVLIVVAFHFFPNIIMAGYIGVDIFFLISGYIITKTTSAKIKNIDDVLKFYQKRLTRILPPLFFMFLLSTLFALVYFDYVELREFGNELLHGATFSYNQYIINNTSYFNQEPSSKVFLNLWSLSVEMQIYLMFPIILLLSRNFKPQYIVTILAASSFIYMLYLGLANNNSAYLSTLSRSWQLSAGVLLALYENPIRNFILSKFRNCHRLVNGLEVIAFAGLICFLVNFSSKSTYPGYYSLVPIVFTCYLLLAGNSSALNNYIFSNPLVVYVGNISYSWYLLHFPILAMCFIVIGELISAYITVFALLTSLLLAVFSYEFVEKRFHV